MRYALEPVVGGLGQQDTQFCISMLQQRLYERGQLPATARTGSYNNETYAALNTYFGPGWDTTPGGACGIYTALLALPAPRYTSYYPQQQLIGGLQPTTWFLIGGGLLALLLLVKK